jgi:hypothetical protein
MTVTITSVEDLTAAQERRRFMIIYRYEGVVYVYNDADGVYTFTHIHCLDIENCLVNEDNVTLLHRIEVPHE